MFILSRFGIYNPRYQTSLVPRVACAGGAVRSSAVCGVRAADDGPISSVAGAWVVHCLRRCQSVAGAVGAVSVALSPSLRHWFVLFVLRVVQRMQVECAGPLNPIGVSTMSLTEWIPRPDYTIIYVGFQ